MKIKKRTSIILILILFITGISFMTMTKPVYAASHSQAEAVAWANAQIGQGLDYDGAYGNQCVDLIAYYYQYLGTSTPGGNAEAYRYNTLPAGWTRVSSPQLGDIAVWKPGYTYGAYSTSGYGHVGIVTGVSGSQITVVNQNFANTPRCTSNSFPVAVIDCYIRPNWITDTTPPTYTDFHVGELRDGAFTVMAKVTDPSGISSVQYAIWTEAGGQDDIIWHAGCCTDGNDYYWARVNFADHKNERGKYKIHMYMTDGAGNQKSVELLYYFDEKGPVISNVVVSDISASGYTVTCTATDDLSVNRVQFPTWTVKNGQDDIVKEWWTNAAVKGKKDGNTYTFRVSAAEHSNETGLYTTHIYAYDLLGNYSQYAVPSVNVHDHKWGSGKITKYPTTAEEGIMEYQCDVCEELKYEHIAKLEETAKPQNPTENPPKQPVQNPDAGEDNKPDTGGDSSVENSNQDYDFEYIPDKVKLKKAKSSKKGELIVKWKGVSADGYQIQYALNKKFTRGKKTKNTDYLESDITLKKLKPNKNYFIRVRAYSKDDWGIKYYGPWSSVKKCKVK